MDSHVPIFRSNLEAAGCLLVDKIDNTELEKWLFSPGPEHLQLLQYCLLQLDQKSVDASVNVTEEGVFHLAKSFGVCNHSGEKVITGTAHREKQCLMWQKVFLLLQEAKKMQEADQTEIEAKKVASSAILHALVRNKDFWSLLGTQVKLLPLGMRSSVVTESIEELHGQLNNAEQKLKETQETHENLADFINGSSTRFDLDHYSSKLNLHLEKIHSSYESLATNIFPHVRNAPSNPACEHLGSIVDAVADKAIGLMEMLRDRQNIKEMTEKILQGDDSNLTFENLSEFDQVTSKCSSLLADTIAVLRQIHLINDEKVLTSSVSIK